MEQTFCCEMCLQERPFVERCRDEAIFAMGWIICARCVSEFQQRVARLEQPFQSVQTRPAQLGGQSRALSVDVPVKLRLSASSLEKQRETSLQPRKRNWTFPHIVGSDYQPSRRNRGLIDAYVASYMRWQSGEHVLAWLRSFDHSQSLRPVFLDTETTGTQRFSEIIEICIVDEQGQTLFHSLVNPTTEIEPMASDVHGLTRQHVKNAPRYPEIHDEVVHYLHNRVIIAYLASFDIRLLKQTADCYEMEFPKFHVGCLLYAYAKYRGVYVEQTNGQHRCKVHRLEDAIRDEALDIPPLHRAERDAQCVQRLFQALRLKSK